jgi:hypothetical protein
MFAKTNLSRNFYMKTSAQPAASSVVNRERASDEAANETSLTVSHTRNPQLPVTSRAASTPDRSFSTRQRVGLGVGIAALGVLAASTVSMGGVLIAQAVRRSTEPDITLGDVLADAADVTHANVFPGTMKDDALLSALASTLHSDPASYLRRFESLQNVIDGYGLPMEGDTLDNTAPKVVLPGAGVSQDVEQEPLKKLIKESDSKGAFFQRPAGIRVIEQAMAQRLGSVEALEKQTAAEALCTLTGQPVEEINISNPQGQKIEKVDVTRSFDRRCELVANQTEAEAAFNAVGAALKQNRPVLLTKPEPVINSLHAEPVDVKCNESQAGGPNMVYAVLGVEAADATSPAKLLVRDPRGHEGAWPAKPANSDPRAQRAAQVLVKFDIDSLGASQITIGDKEVVPLGSTDR